MANPSTRTLPIDGMTCRSCEIHLEEAIGGVAGVATVRVDHRRGVAVIQSGRGSVIHDADLSRAVEAAGYRVGRTRSLWFSRDVRVYTDVAAAVALLGFIVLVATISGISFPSLTGTSSRATALVALLVGLTAGFSTCMALIGGIILGAAARFAEARTDLTTWQKFRPHLLFNGGRIGGFALLGGILGAGGAVLRPSDSAIAVLTLIVGSVMLLLGATLTKVSPRVAQLAPALPRLLQWRGRQLRARPAIATSASGALSFFLPCGFTFAMQLAALQSGSFGAGALLMAAFAVGTAPGLLGVAGLTAIMRGRVARLFFVTAGVVVLLLGIWNVRSALTVLGGNVGPIAGGTTFGSDAPATATRTIRMTQGDYGYTPNRFTVTQGERVRWIITSTNPYSCASAFRVPRLGIRQQLQPGENVIEFVATQVGPIAFHCGMGMYRGAVLVIPPA